MTIRSIPLNICKPVSGVANVCYLTGQQISRHESVYVLKSDEDLVQQNKPVACISSAGLTRLLRR
eukprot:UN00817